MIEFLHSLDPYIVPLFGEIDFSAVTPIQVLTDVGITTLFIWIIITFIRKINALHIFLTGIFLGSLLFVSLSFNLYATKFILQVLLIVLALSIPLMFPPEIRRTLEKIGSISHVFFRKNTHTIQHSIIKTLKQSSDYLAEKRHGALIVLEQSIPLDTYAHTGIPLDTKISKDIILSIFYPKSPLHDGAIIVRKDRIVCAGAVLPLAMDSVTERGTRHRSALGLSEMTDAIIIVVSEERGSISIAHDKNILKNVSSEFLEHFLEEHLSTV